MLIKNKEKELKKNELNKIHSFPIQENIKKDINEK